jgi:hypothetical protein
MSGDSSSVGKKTGCTTKEFDSLQGQEMFWSLWSSELHHRVLRKLQTGYWVRLASFPLGSEGSFPRGKAAWPWSRPQPTSCAEIQNTQTPYIDPVVLWLRTRTSLLLLNTVRSHSKPQTCCDLSKVKGTFVPVFKSLSTTPWSRIKRSGGVAPSLLTLALDGGEWSASRPCRFAPSKTAPGAHFIGDGVGAALDAVEKSPVPAVSRTPNPRSSNP